MQIYKNQRRAALKTIKNFIQRPNIQIRIVKHILYITIFLICLFSCENKTINSTAVSPFGTDTVSKGENYDLEQILEAGELIIVTMTGPESYYDYHGRSMGIQYELAEKFAQSQGLRLRVEVARDSADLEKMLRNADADLIAYELPKSLIEKKGFIPCGCYSDSVLVNKKYTQAIWAVRKKSTMLAEALDEWFKPEMKQQTRKENSERMAYGGVKRHVRAPYLSLKKGIISPYDEHFMRHSRNIGWDWKLMAAQCYQESGFDPQAVSWAGAKGLMQIMPGTANHLGLPLEQIYNPEANIEAAARYLNQLTKRFSKIRDRNERIKFVLAAYNGGYHHVNDAMTLAQKYGKNPTSWEDVSYYVLNLSKSQYYNDPVVKYGYMIGSETYNYVNTIMERWRKYRGASSGRPSLNIHLAPSRATRNNRFSKKNEILHPDDPRFSEFNENKDEE